MPILAASNGILKDEKFSSSLNEEWKHNFSFVQAADTQLGFINLLGDKDKDGILYPNTTWEREIELCKITVEKLNAMNPKPEFFIICGDLVDAYPNKYPKIRDAQIKDFKEALAGLSEEISVICVCGNHDVGEVPTHQTVAKYNKDFGDDHFYFWCKGVLFIVLNSQYYVDATRVPDLKKAQDNWLDHVLSLEERKKAKHTIMFQHIPWFLHQWDEKNVAIDVKNTLRTKQLVVYECDDQTTDVLLNIEKATRLSMLEKLHKAGVNKIFCGHAHFNCGGYYKNMEIVVTTAVGIQLGQDKHGIRLVQVQENDIKHKYFKIEDVPKNINLFDTHEPKDICKEIDTPKLTFNGSKMNFLKSILTLIGCTRRSPPPPVYLISFSVCKR